jgi:hypothetical protein
MRSHRGSWFGSCLLAAAFASMPGACTIVRAQPGFGPDPFWPYNDQYTPYTAPIGPAEPMAGGRAAMIPQSGVRGANQFQQYLEGLQGAGRNMTDRASIGMPYYRSSVDPRYDTKGTRQYQPNQRSNQTFERAQQRVADRYFAYYSTRDPARRSELLREYRAARRDADRATTGRERPPSRDLEEPSVAEPGSRRGTGAGSAASRTGVSDRTRARSDRFGSAPEVPGAGSSRSSGSTYRRTTPTDILNRSRAMDRGSSLAPSVTGPRARRPSMEAGEDLLPGSASSSYRSRARRPAQSALDTPAAADDDSDLPAPSRRRARSATRPAAPGNQ